MNNYEVIVGNVGLVYEGTSLSKALEVYEDYFVQSSKGYGRVAGEEVTLMLNGEPV